MPWRTEKHMMELFDLADRQGYDVTQSTMRDHVRLIGPDDKSVKTTRAAMRSATLRRSGIWRRCRMGGVVAGPLKVLILAATLFPLGRLLPRSGAFPYRRACAGLAGAAL